MTLVLHFNAFSGKLDGGYLMIGGKKSGSYMTAAAVIGYLAANPEVRCDPLKV